MKGWYFVMMNVHTADVKEEEMVVHANEDLVSQVESASPAQLTAILFNGCLNFIDAGKYAMQNKNYESANNYLQKAQRIINEFRLTLDPQYDISKQLDMLYEYSYNQLVQGNIKSDLQSIDNAQAVIHDLRDTWLQAIENVQTQ